VALALTFFGLTAWFARPVDAPSTAGFAHGSLWNSPDEAANAFWAGQVATGRPLAVRDVVIGFGAGAIHPRSMAVNGDALVPGSFPGLILMFGALKLLLHLPFHLITPLMTALSGLLFGLLVARLFDRHAGFWAAALFFVHPAVIYYASRGLFHNVLFIDLLIVAATFFVLRPLRSRFGRGETIDDVLGGFFFAWAMMTRTSEALWAIPAFALFLPFAGSIRWRRLVAALVGAALPAFLFLFINASLYGSPFRTGYNPAPAAAQAVPATIASSAPASTVPLLPQTFGFHPRLILEHLWSYGLSFFWWFSLLAIIGLAWWLIEWKKARTPQVAFASATAVVCAWLAAFYGSWLLFDRFDPTQVTIGVSYVRYFLPAYVVGVPFAAFALAKISRSFGKPWIAAGAFLLISVLSVRLAVFAGDESLNRVHLTLEGNAEKKRVLLQAIPPDAVVMTERFDKLLVPERIRLITATDPSSFSAAEAAASFAPVYWYGLDPSPDEFKRLTAAAHAAGLRFASPSSPVASETLYRLTPEKP
jgi:hypothetical protein